VVPHLDTTAASLSGGGAGLVFVVSLLGVNVKRGINRGNDKWSHCSCHGGSTSPAFVVGLLDVDNKRGGNRGVVAVAGWQWRRRRPGVCCRPAWQDKKDRVGRQQGATGAHNLRALQEGVRLILVQWF